MYLSRVEINPRLRACKLALNSPQRLHAIIAASFPSIANDDVAARRHLWRLDKLNHSLYVLVVSKSKPDFSHLIEQIGWPASEQNWETTLYDPFLAHLQTGQQWQFRLLANPTVSKKNQSDSSSQRVRGKVIPCSSIDDQKQWLETKIIKHGATLDGFELANRTVSQFIRNGSTITLSTATFEGILTISSPDLLREAMTSGVGRARAYGCGLLTLAQVSR